MVSTYTTNNSIEKPGSGDQANTWDVTANLNFDVIDRALDGIGTVTLAAVGTSGTPNTLAISTTGALSEGQHRVVIFDDGGDLGGTAYVQLTPNDAEKVMFVVNSLSGSRSILLFQGTYNASNDYELKAGETSLVRFDGAGAGAVVTRTISDVGAPDSVDIDGGAIDGAIVGANSAAAGTFTTLSATGIDGTPIGGSTPAAGAFTTLSTTGATTLSDDLTFTNADPEILGGDTNGALWISAGTSTSLGANIILRGDTHTSPGDVFFRNDTTDTLQYDVSTTTWDFQANDITTTGTITGGELVSTNDLTFTGTDPQIIGGDINGTLYISPSTAANLGGNIYLNGNTHTNAGDIGFRSDAADTLTYDDSASSWDFQANAVTTTGTLAAGATTVTGTLSATGTVDVAGDIVHTGDTNNKIGFTTDIQTYTTGGTTRMDISNSGVKIGTGTRVTTILDEAAMGTDSATALATQQSIKAYVDANSWQRVNDDEPTSDVSAITFTGLSGNSYRALRISGILVLVSSTQNLKLQIRATSGTWREIGATAATAGAQDAVLFDWTLYNFDGAAAANIIASIGGGGAVPGAIDRSSNSTYVTGRDVDFGYSSYSETIDEIRVIPNSGNIEGSTADQRGFVILEAI